MTDQSPFIWHELVTPDQKTSGAFFSQLFGWTRKEVDAGKFGTYTLFQKDGLGCCGIDESNTGDAKPRILLAFVYRRKGRR